MRLASILAWLVILLFCLAIGAAVFVVQVALYDTTKSPPALWVMATLLFLCACTLYLSWRDARDAVHQQAEQRWEQQPIHREAIPLNRRRA